MRGVMNGIMRFSLTENRPKNRIEAAEDLIRLRAVNLLCTLSRGV
jgi:hypothetical protein